MLQSSEGTERSEATNRHGVPARQSYHEVRNPNGSSRLDPERAHAAAGDPGCERFLPKSCLLCEAKALSRAAAQAAAADWAL